jgi:hypothetical protein
MLPSGATTVVGVLLTLRMFRVDPVLLDGLPDFSQPDGLLIGLPAALALLLFGMCLFLI